MSTLALFHFLRPGCLWLLLPAVLLVWLIHRRQDQTRSWKKVISSELLEHLLVRSSVRESRLRPLRLLLILWVVGIIALAGPTWQREASPFTEDQAGLFIVLKVSPEMLAQDIQPSRLQRSVQKIDDLLDLRPGTKTGLIAYSGSAHLVMPLTSDASIIKEFAGQLAPDVMPSPGDNPVAALRLAQQRLALSSLPGSILLVTDVINPADLGSLQALGNEFQATVHLLAMAAGPDVIPPPDSPPAPALDKDSMESAASALGGSLVLPTADDADVRRLNSKIDTSIASAPAQQGERWKDNGYFLLPLLALLLLAFFRPGGAVALQ